MKTFQVIVMALSASLGLVKQQIVRTFGRETSSVDKEVIDIILSNPKNKERLIKELNENKKPSIEIMIEGKNFSIVNSN